MCDNRGTKSMSLHIGQHIKSVWEVYQTQHHMTVVEFARLICVERQTPYNIFKRENIDIQLLARISKVLEHDFFKDLSDDLSSRDNDAPGNTT